MNTTKVTLSIVNNSAYSYIPEIRKIEVKSHKRIIISVIDPDDGVKVIDFDFSALQDGIDTKSNRDGYAGNMYQVTAYDSGVTNFLVCGYASFNFNQIYEITSYPSFPYLAEGETEISDTITVKFDWLPSIQTDSEIKNKLILKWKNRIGNAANTFSPEHIGEFDLTSQAYYNTRDFFKGWLGAAWHAIKNYELGTGIETPEQIESLVNICEDEIQHGAKHWHYLASQTTAHITAWADRFSDYKLYTINEDTGMPDSNWREDENLDSFTPTEFAHILNICYQQAQAYSVGVGE